MCQAAVVKSLLAGLCSFACWLLSFHGLRELLPSWNGMHVAWLLLVCATPVFFAVAVEQPLEARLHLAGGQRTRLAKSLLCREGSQLLPASKLQEFTGIVTATTTARGDWAVKHQEIKCSSWHALFYRKHNMADPRL